MKEAAARLALGLAVIAAAASAQARVDLFDEHGILRLKLEGPFRELAAKAGTDFSAPGTLRTSDGRELPLTASVFGKSRVELCSMPPLVLTLEEEPARGTLFEGHQPLRLVTHCGHKVVDDRWAVLEYLTYRAYQLVAETALEVRLARIEYRDTARPGHRRLSHAFFVEDINRAAEKRGLEWLAVERQPPAELEPLAAATMALFQYMIGNTDFSMIDGPPGERCCHNMAVLGTADASSRSLLPFDFDHAGLVDAPYATPNPTLGIRSVTQRKYRGLCIHNDVLPEAIEHFESRRGAITTLFTDLALPHPKPRRRALRYIERFYAELENPKKRARLAASCRPSRRAD